VCVGVVAATLLGATGSGGLEALQQVIIVVGLPFFAMGYVMIYSILRALKEDAGERPPLSTKRWRKVLPPEEEERRRQERLLEREAEERQGALLEKTGSAPRSRPGIDLRGEKSGGNGTRP
jgi:choline-glycine betaine transporter